MSKPAVKAVLSAQQDFLRLVVQQAAEIAPGGEMEECFRALRYKRAAGRQVPLSA
jgi:hypothetical protein